MKHKTFISLSSSQTEKLGKELAKKILKFSSQNKAVVIALEGDLGGGKTTFLKGFAKGLGVKDKILSPTFVIMKKFQVPSFMFQGFYHFDCYRIKSPHEILSLGFKEIISKPENIIAIEWAENIKQALPPKDVLRLKFEIKGLNKRKIVVFRRIKDKIS